MIWTLDAPTEHHSVVRNSVFHTHAAPVTDEAEAMAFLHTVAVPDATHNCWAFRTGQRFRSSDDGEPSGTAGRPILAAIDGQSFDNVMVVVIRWFGGVKLGAGGLVRAYGGAAAACLREAPKSERIETRMLHFHCPFSLFARLEARCATWGAQKTDTQFDSNGVQLALAVPLSILENVTTELRDMTRGQIHIQCDDE
nr:YigZ family protein [uncultured Neokomagataea sp.]